MTRNRFEAVRPTVALRNFTYNCKLLSIATGYPASTRACRVSRKCAAPSYRPQSRPMLRADAALRSTGVSVHAVTFDTQPVRAHSRSNIANPNSRRLNVAHIRRQVANAIADQVDEAIHSGAFQPRDTLPGDRCLNIATIRHRVRASLRCAILSHPKSLKHGPCVASLNLMSLCIAFHSISLTVSSRPIATSQPTLRGSGILR